MLKRIREIYSSGVRAIKDALADAQPNRERSIYESRGIVCLETEAPKSVNPESKLEGATDEN